MLCEKPFIRIGKVEKKGLILSEEYRNEATPFPCGKCFACRVNKARLWQLRILLESLTHEENCFVTFTYSDENLPSDMSLHPEDMSEFFKRLRAHYYPAKIRYYYSGEYGERNERPHYHSAIFGSSAADEETYIKKWDKGFIMVGDLNKFTARYMAGYVVKGWTFKGCDKLEGRHPEFQRMSRKPGLGCDAIKMIADKLKRREVDKNVKELIIDNRSVRLGRYLQDKLDQALNVDHNLRGLEYYDYMTDFFEKYIGKGDLLNNVLDSNDYKRRRLKKTVKIYNRRNKI